MLPVIGWRVYCADGTSYTRDAHLIPPTVQVVVNFHAPPYRTLEYGADTYRVDGVTLRGAWMTDEAFARVVACAHADRDWP